MKSARLRGPYGCSAGIHDLDENGEPFCGIPYAEKEEVNFEGHCVDCVRARVRRLEAKRDGEGTHYLACECRERQFAEAMELKRLLEALPHNASMYHWSDDTWTVEINACPSAQGKTPLEALRNRKAGKK